MSAAFKPTPHPIFKLPAPAVLRAMGGERALALLEEREVRIAEEKAKPWECGYQPSSWATAKGLLKQYNELWLMGGNRAGKTEFASRLVVETLLSGPRKRVWCFQTTAPNSVEMQQPYVWKYLPEELKAINTKRGAIANISYSQKNGFTENTFVLPNGSQCWFRNYAQDDRTIEGGELDLIWFDELVPINFVETCRYRLVSRAGDLLVTFTAKDGYTATVKAALSGARTIETRAAELLPLWKEGGGVKVLAGHEEQPIVQESARGNAAILYFWSEDNPFGGYPALMRTLKNAPREQILMRAYGVPTKAIGSRFPLFSDKVHVVRHENIPREGTNYHLVDPCGGRNWFQIWVRIDTANRAYVYREWPDQDSYIDGVGYPGEWATPDGKLADGKQGPAQKGFGFGLERYKEEVEMLESGTHERWRADGAEVMFERWMDSRYGNAQTTGKEAPTTLIEDCSQIGMDFLATPGQGVDEGIQLINDWLSYDTRRPVDALNHPRLMISERCKNVIYALQEWTGADGKNGATKDPIDLLRYLVLCGAENVEGDILNGRRGGAY